MTSKQWSKLLCQAGTCIEQLKPKLTVEAVPVTDFGKHGQLQIEVTDRKGLTGNIQVTVSQKNEVSCTAHGKIEKNLPGKHVRQCKESLPITDLEIFLSPRRATGIEATAPILPSR